MSNLEHEVVEVYRDSQPGPKAPYGYRYASKTVLSRRDTVSPRCRPDVSISVDDLLHPAGASAVDEQPPPEA